VGQRQLNREHRAGAWLTLDVDRPAMIFDDAVTDRQPEAGPFPDVFGRKKRIKEAGLDVGRDSGTRVADDDLSHCAPSLRSYHNGLVSLRLHGVPGIRDEIDQHLFQLNGAPQNDGLGLLKI